jgi:hypothetical protein
MLICPYITLRINAFLTSLHLADTLGLECAFNVKVNGLRFCVNYLFVNKVSKCGFGNIDTLNHIMFQFSLIKTHLILGGQKNILSNFWNTSYT